MNNPSPTGSTQTFREKVTEGLHRAYRKLVEREAKEDGYLVLARNGKIENVKAKDLLKELNKAV